MKVGTNVDSEGYDIATPAGFDLRLVDLIFNVPVNNFSVMLGRSHHFPSWKYLRV